MNERCVYEGTIAGVGFKKEAWRLWMYTKPRVGDPLYFYHETKNVHDPKAIAIKYAQRAHAPKIGYIPRNKTAAFHEEHQHGMSIRGEVLLLNGPNTVIRAYAFDPDADETDEMPVVASEEEV